MTRFVLTPGKAGTQHSDYYGGGGGGVLVNGEKPNSDDYNGEGFGGGGGDGDSGNNGCVLIEV